MTQNFFPLEFSDLLVTLTLFLIVNAHRSKIFCVYQIIYSSMTLRQNCWLLLVTLKPLKKMSQSFIYSLLFLFFYNQFKSIYRRMQFMFYLVYVYKSS